MSSTFPEHPILSPPPRAERTQGMKRNLWYRPTNSPNDLAVERAFDLWIEQAPGRTRYLYFRDFTQAFRFGWHTVYRELHFRPDACSEWNIANDARSYYDSTHLQEGTRMDRKDWASVALEGAWRCYSEGRKVYDEAHRILPGPEFEARYIRTAALIATQPPKARSRPPKRAA